MKYIKSIIISFIIILIIVSSNDYKNSFLCFNCQDSNITINDEEKILITGFGPFDIYDVNPSQLIAESLNGTYINEFKLNSIILPVDYTESVNFTINNIEKINPVLIISLGLSPKANLIEVEKIGVNLKQNDNDEKNWLFLQKIDQNGPFFRISSINTRKVVLYLREAGIPAHQSFSAGLYICNAVLYETLGYIENKNLPIKMCFIHVPFIKSQDSNGMDLDKMINAVQLAINCILIDF
jgi:pyroglutamyl-peptidase